MEYKEVVSNWQSFASAVRDIGGEVQVLAVEDRAALDGVLDVERKLGMDIPKSLRDVLLNFSGKVEFRWYFPKDYELNGELGNIFSGERHWSLEWLVEFNRAKDGWVESCFPDAGDRYDVVWHNKFAFHEVGNGDYLAIDIKDAKRQPVIYLSHDDGEGHGIELAENFKEFVYESSKLGCVGGEDWQMLPFLGNEKRGLNSESENAKLFRELLGVKIA